MPALRELDINATIIAAQRLKEATANVRRLVDIENLNANLDANNKYIPMAYAPLPPILTLSSPTPPHSSTPVATTNTTTTTAAQRSGDSSTNNNNSNTSSTADANENDNIFVDPDAGFEIKYNCNQIRKRITTFINNGGMKVGEFQEKLRVSSRSYHTFMRQSGPHAGFNNNTYASAHQFFVARERAGLKMPRAKKSSSAAASAGTGAAGAAAANEDRFTITPDTPQLEGEDSGTVPVFETCDDVRRKIGVHLRRDGVTQAAFARELSKCVGGGGAGGGTGQIVTSKNVGDFVRKSGGPMAGNTTRAFYAAYVYFEKLRVKENKPKSKKRLEMEKMHGAKGVDRDDDMGPNRHFWLTKGESISVNKYGKYEHMSANGRVRVID